jgi:hypothetical protein
MTSELLSESSPDRFSGATERSTELGCSNSVDSELFIPEKYFEEVYVHPNYFKKMHRIKEIFNFSR